MAVPKKTFNMRYTEREKKRLERLAKARGISAAAFLRSYINLTFIAEFSKKEGS